MVQRSQNFTSRWKNPSPRMAGNAYSRATQDTFLLCLCVATCSKWYLVGLQAMVVHRCMLLQAMHAYMMNRLPRLPRKSIGAAQGSPAWASQTLGAAQQFHILLGLLANFRIRKTLGAVRYFLFPNQSSHTDQVAHAAGWARMAA